MRPGHGRARGRLGRKSVPAIRERRGRDRPNGNCDHAAMYLSDLEKRIDLGSYFYYSVFVSERIEKRAQVFVHRKKIAREIREMTRK